MYWSVNFVRECLRKGEELAEGGFSASFDMKKFYIKRYITLFMSITLPGICDGNLMKL